MKLSPVNENFWSFYLCYYYYYSNLFLFRNCQLRKVYATQNVITRARKKNVIFLSFANITAWGLRQQHVKAEPFKRLVRKNIHFIWCACDATISSWSWLNSFETNKTKQNKNIKIKIKLKSDLFVRLLS